MVFEKCRCYRVVSSPFIIPCPKPCKWPDQVFFFSLSLYGGKVGGGGEWRGIETDMVPGNATHSHWRPKARPPALTVLWKFGGPVIQTHSLTHSLSHSTHTMAGRPAEVGRHSHEPPLHLQTGFCNTWHNSQAHTLSLYTHASVRGSAQ